MLGPKYHAEFNGAGRTANEVDELKRYVARLVADFLAA